MNEQQTEQTQPIQQPITKKPRFRWRIVLIVFGSIIVAFGAYVGIAYIIAFNANPPICSSHDKCADFCDSPYYADPAQISCEKKKIRTGPPDLKDTRSTFEKWLAGDASIIEIINPNQKYCTCYCTGMIDPSTINQLLDSEN